MNGLNLTRVGWWTLICLLSPGPAWAQTNVSPHFQEVLRLLRAHLPGVTEDELNRAAVQGLLDGFRPRVLLVTEGSERETRSDPLVSRTAVYEDAFGYIRLSRVTAGVAEQFSSAFDKLRSAQTLKGLVLDLRYAEGEDYQAAADLADRFLTREQPLLAWGESSARSTAKAEALPGPLAVLVNGETAAAAEALSEVLRTARVALLVGGPTAGQAFTFREFPLEDGSRLRIASTPVRVGDDLALTNRVRPDIAVDVPADQARIHFTDPFENVTVAAAVPVDSAAVSTVRTNRPSRPRINEAELVRRRREQLSLDDLPGALARLDSARDEKTLQDAVLVRALDVLKGIAVVAGPQSRR